MSSTQYFLEFGFFLNPSWKFFSLTQSMVNNSLTIVKLMKLDWSKFENFVISFSYGVIIVTVSLINKSYIFNELAAYHR